LASDILAVIEHGPHHARERLLVTRTQPREDKTTMATARLAAHRIGWLPASPLQQSLLCTGRSVWGDGAALAAVPAWRPEQIDPRRALDELRGAERRLTSGDAARAAWQAAGALLVARRAYTAFEAEREAALAAAWPEAPSMHETAPVEFVRAARSLIEDWFYVWEANGPTHAARTKFERLRALAGSIA
jgi:hypothetical protein